MTRLVSIITSDVPTIRDTPIEELCQNRSASDLLEECASLDAFRRESRNLYHQVRALFFLYAIRRFYLPPPTGSSPPPLIPLPAIERLHARQFDAAIDQLLDAERRDGASDAIGSALAAAYRELGLQTLADQVKRSVRAVDGNRWMFEVSTPADYPLTVSPSLFPEGVRRPVLREATPVRMDFTHSAWSDIFFLGMDFPEGARVLNVSIDLAISGRDPTPLPPIETELRVCEEPVLRLVSIDLDATVTLRSLDALFDFGADYLGLIKAAVIASGLIPPGAEGSDQPLSAYLERLVGEGRGLEIRSRVRGIPKGSRLAVSTHLLASLIALCMRATGQTKSLTGPLEEEERRLIVARAILGEWLGGSGGGWQDSGGLWPGVKRIEGGLATPADAEFGVSRGRLLPIHQVLKGSDASPSTLEDLQRSLVLIHGGMAQNVGPILEMVTEKYLLRCKAEWAARRDALSIFDRVLAALKAGDIRAIGHATQSNFDGPIQTIIPQANNAFTTRLIDQIRADYGDQFWGFWMLGGMSGGGMGLLFDPIIQPRAKAALPQIMIDIKREFEAALPFAMDPVVYDFAINNNGTFASLLDNADDATPVRASADEPNTLATSVCTGDSLSTLDALLDELGFDRDGHEEIRAALQAGTIGLARNRIANDVVLEDVSSDDLLDATSALPSHFRDRGVDALSEGRVAIVTLGAGVGSRWTQGAGVVKAIHPFARFAGSHRSFLEAHLAKTRRTTRRFGVTPPHIITTSHLTHAPIQEALDTLDDPSLRLIASTGRSIGLRLIPTVRDLRFSWEETVRQVLDEQAQKVRESQQAALIAWARDAGEASDYRDNLPAQCLHPVGHFYEIPNLLLNGTLERLLCEHPDLTTLFLHNIDTLGANLDPALLGAHLERNAGLTFEVVRRRIDDRGGGLARVDGRVRLVESLALPREEGEFRLSYYNSMSTWIDVEQLLALFRLTRDDLSNVDRVSAAVRRLARLLPTYVTIKDVKKRWGQGHEDIFPVTQFEKLWGDLSSLPEANCNFIAVPRERGQQLKDPAQLDGWLRDGSAKFMESLCDWT